MWWGGGGRARQQLWRSRARLLGNSGEAAVAGPARDGRVEGDDARHLAPGAILLQPLHPPRDRIALRVVVPRPQLVRVERAWGCELQLQRGLITRHHGGVEPLGREQPVHGSASRLRRVRVLAARVRRRQDWQLASVGAEQSDLGQLNAVWVLRRHEPQPSEDKAEGSAHRCLRNSPAGRRARSQSKQRGNRSAWPAASCS